jgi:DNA repair protein RecO (recombination protein O)
MTERRAPIRSAMPVVHDEGVCIRQWDWSETSQTVSVFCRDLGLVKALAKGAKRQKAPYSGGVELLTRGHAGVIVRPNTELALLTEWDLQETFPALRRSLAAHNAGLYMADLVQHSLHDHDPHRALYDSLMDNLRALSDDGSRGLAVLRFQWATLAETGYKPSLRIDVSSGAELAEAGAYRFSAALGGLMADNTAPAPGDATGRTPPGVKGAWRVRTETVAVLRLVEQNRPAAEGRALPPQAVERANRLLAVYLRHVLGREPRTLPLLFGRHLPR